jgi:hypothetical protein
MPSNSLVKTGKKCKSMFLQDPDLKFDLILRNFSENSLRTFSYRNIHVTTNLSLVSSAIYVNSFLLSLYLSEYQKYRKFFPKIKVNGKEKIQKTVLEKYPVFKYFFIIINSIYLETYL